MRQSTLRWASTEFGRADLGDTRRRERLVRVAARVYERASGSIAAAFKRDKEREGAYDFVENRHVDADEITAASVQATLDRIERLPYVVVPVDGTSITITDRHRKRDFGRVGSNNNGARGLKLVDALAVQPDGTVAGWLALTFWARPDADSSASDHQLRARPIEEKETRYWVGAIEAARNALDERGVRGWFQVDREGDGHDLLTALQGTDHWWTVRGNADRSIEIDGGTKALLRAQLLSRRPAGEYLLKVPGRSQPKRTARTARMVVRVAEVVLRMRDRANHGRITRLAVTAVWAREEGTTPAGEEPIDWLLYTNVPVVSLQDALRVVRTYALRWRVEDCHRTWKTGRCNVESTQLRSFAAVKRWAIILIVIAARIERIKHLSRTTPDAPASVELSPFELRALVALKYEGKPPPQGELTIGQATRIIAEFGGWANKYSKTKRPGSVVLGRGLEYLQSAAELLEVQAARK